MRIAYFSTGPVEAARRYDSVVWAAIDCSSGASASAPPGSRASEATSIPSATNHPPA